MSFSNPTSLFLPANTALLTGQMAIAPGAKPVASESPLLPCATDTSTYSVCDPFKQIPAGSTVHVYTPWSGASLFDRESWLKIFEEQPEGLFQNLKPLNRQPVEVIDLLYPELVASERDADVEVDAVIEALSKVVHPMPEDMSERIHSRLEAAGLTISDPPSTKVDELVEALRKVVRPMPEDLSELIRARLEAAGVPVSDPASTTERSDHDNSIAEGPALKKDSDKENKS